MYRQQDYGGYPNQGGYPQGGGYPPPAGYPPPGGYPQPGFVNPCSFAPTSGGGYPENSGGELGQDEEVKGFDFTDKSIRLAFIRKVYAILMLQLLVTFGFISFCLFHEPTKKFLESHLFLIWIALAVLMVTMFSMICCTSVRRKYPMNFIFLGLFTVAEALILGFISSCYSRYEVLLAVGTTTAVCLALTLFAFQTKWDFTKLSGFLLCASIVLLVFAIVAIFFKNRIYEMVYGSLGALIFSFYLVYDTQLMMGGKHKYSISPEDYIFAALNLYLDVINIFLYILKIIGAANK